jgi:hypothetical protein
MATCSDNTRLGRIGCGATYHGELQHSVAKVSWSTHPDGMAHITASLSLIDILWNKGGGDTMVDPATVLDKTGTPRFRLDTRGIWRNAAPFPDRLKRGYVPDVTQNAEESRPGICESDANSGNVPTPHPNLKTALCNEPVNDPRVYGHRPYTCYRPRPCPIHDTPDDAA